MTNITDIGTAIENLNTSFTFNSTDVLTNANNYANQNSDGWIGLIIFIIFGIAIIIFLNKNKNEFKLINDVSFLLYFMLLMLDVGFILYQYRILYELQPLIFLFTSFIVVCLFSMLKKERDTYSQ